MKLTTIRTGVYKRAIKPMLFLAPPDTVHAYTTHLAYGAGIIPGVPNVMRKVAVRKRPELASTWRGLQFTSPVGLSAGFDKNAKAVTMMRAIGFGFSTVGSVTAQPCEGNPKPWFHRLPKTQSLAVHAGLANDGSKKILSRLSALPASLRKKYPIVLSVARTNSQDASGADEGVADFVATVTAAKDNTAVSIIELNISCPNAYGGETYTTPALLEKLLASVDAVKAPQPKLVKMPVDLPWSQFKSLLDVIVKHDVAGVTIANLTKDRRRIDFKDPISDAVKGGLSGAPVRDLSTALIRKTYQAYGDMLTIFGVGGILSVEDAYEKITNGASYIETITGLIFNGPGFVEELNGGIAKLLKRDGFTHLSQAVGSALTKK